ncbi:alpha/beta fold hydrolase [Candidatus Woesearchaeota archaeon]|nr:alpha/beta fold hydrolase [Candidatus Woesearchaeota archaeon]
MPKRRAAKKQQAKPSLIGRCKEWCTMRRLIKLGVIVIAAAIIISLASYAVSVRVKLLFDTETHITISPSIKSIAVPDKTPPEVTFTTTVEHLRVCDLSCTHALLDAANDEVVSQVVKPAGKDTATYALPLTDEGAGQAIFSYTVTCTTADKGLCPSKGKTYTKTAFVTVDHGMSEEERGQQVLLRSWLVEEAARLASIQESYANSTFILDALWRHANVDEDVIAAALLGAELAEAEREQANIIGSWGEERYDEAERALEARRGTLDELLAATKALLSSSSRKLEEYNEAVSALSQAHQSRSVINGIAGLLTAANDEAYQSLLVANSTYTTIAARPADHGPASLRRAAASISEAFDEAVVAYEQVIDARGAAERRIKEDYFSAVKARNHTWPGDGCAAYEELLLLLNGTDAVRIEEYLATYCAPQQAVSFFAAEPPPHATPATPSPVIPVSIPEPEPQCCYQGRCKPCDTPGATPVILVHGHSFNRAASPELAFTRLSSLQDALAEDGYVHAGTINAEAAINEVPPGTWGRVPAPVVVSVTYYYLNYYDLGKLSFITRKTDSIEGYAIRLKEAVDTVREKTGSEEVIIVAHSMGGLVAREYLSLFGDEHVSKLITLGTPNHGVQGDIRKYCTLTGAERECDDMAAGSLFLRRLNSPGNVPGHAEVYTIRAEGCPTRTDAGTDDQGDGVVLAESVVLGFAEENHVVEGECTDLLRTSLHMDFVNPERYPETYAIIRGILRRD